MTISKTRELTIDEIDSVTGGLAFSFLALNPQPIPPGRIDFAQFQTALPLGFPRAPGCPGPVILPPSPC